MKRSILLLALVALVALAATALAQSDATYTLTSWSTASAISAVSAEGRYRVTGTSGDVSAGPPMSGGTYSVTGGYVAGSPPPAAGRRLYLPSIRSR